MEQEMDNGKKKEAMDPIMMEEDHINKIMETTEKTRYRAPYQYCWVCVIFFARVVVSERLHRARGGVQGGGPPARGFGGSALEKKNLARHIFAGFEPTYYRRFRADIFPGPHDIRWFSAHGFCRWFSISG
jgi:hypothetical protein